MSTDGGGARSRRGAGRASRPRPRAAAARSSQGDLASLRVVIGAGR